MPKNKKCKNNSGGGGGPVGGVGGGWIGSKAGDSG